jgi:hypothetical protein
MRYYDPIETAETRNSASGRVAWCAAIYSARYALALGFLYVVGCAITALLLALGELEVTAARGDELVRVIPYWRVVE